MIELTNIQADKICEIVDVKFDHYNPAQYKDSPYNDTEPQYYFWSSPISHPSFKINRITGEYKEDELIEKLIFMFPMDILISMKDFSDNKERVEEAINTQQKLIDKKKAVLDYLISEGLI